MAGVVYGLNLWLVSHLSYPHAGVWALLPWLLWATERLVRRPDAIRRRRCWPSWLVRSSWPGIPESSFHVAAGHRRLLRAPPGARRAAPTGRRGGLSRPLLAMAGGLAAGAALAGVLLVPFGELLFNSADLAERSGTGVDKHVEPELPARLLPLRLLGPRHRHGHSPVPVRALLVRRARCRSCWPPRRWSLRPRAERIWIAGAGGAAAGRGLRRPAGPAGRDAPAAAQPRPQRSADRDRAGVPGAAGGLGARRPLRAREPRGGARRAASSRVRGGVLALRSCGSWRRATSTACSPRAALEVALEPDGPATRSATPPPTT